MKRFIKGFFALFFSLFSFRRLSSKDYTILYELYLSYGKAKKEQSLEDSVSGRLDKPQVKAKGKVKAVKKEEIKKYLELLKRFEKAKGALQAIEDSIHNKKFNKEDSLTEIAKKEKEVDDIEIAFNDLKREKFIEKAIKEKFEAKRDGIRTLIWDIKEKIVFGVIGEVEEIKPEELQAIRQEEEKKTIEEVEHIWQLINTVQKYDRFKDKQAQETVKSFLKAKQEEENKKRLEMQIVLIENSLQEIKKAEEEELREISRKLVCREFNFFLRFFTLPGLSKAGDERGRKEEGCRQRIKKQLEYEEESRKQIAKAIEDLTNVTRQILAPTITTLKRTLSRKRESLQYVESFLKEKAVLQESRISGLDLLAEQKAQIMSIFQQQFETEKRKQEEKLKKMREEFAARICKARELAKLETEKNSRRQIQPGKSSQAIIDKKLYAEKPESQQKEEHKGPEEADKRQKALSKEQKRRQETIRQVQEKQQLEQTARKKQVEEKRQLTIARRQNQLKEEEFWELKSKEQIYDRMKEKVGNDKARGIVEKKIEVVREKMARLEVAREGYIRKKETKRQEVEEMLEQKAVTYESVAKQRQEEADKSRKVLGKEQKRRQETIRQVQEKQQLEQTARKKQVEEKRQLTIARRQNQLKEEEFWELKSKEQMYIRMQEKAADGKLKLRLEERIKQAQEQLLKLGEAKEQYVKEKEKIKEKALKLQDEEQAKLEDNKGQQRLTRDKIIALKKLESRKEKLKEGKVKIKEEQKRRKRVLALERKRREEAIREARLEQIREEERRQQLKAQVSEKEKKAEESINIEQNVEITDDLAKGREIEVSEELVAKLEEATISTEDKKVSTDEVSEDVERQKLKVEERKQKLLEEQQQKHEEARKKMKERELALEKRRQEIQRKREEALARARTDRRVTQVVQTETQQRQAEEEQRRQKVLEGQAKKREEVRKKMMEQELALERRRQAKKKVN